MKIPAAIGWAVTTASCALLLAPPANSAPLLCESFDYGTTSGNISGKGGNEPGFTNAEHWAAAGSYDTNGLTFSSLVTTGGCLALWSGNGPYRGIEVNPGGDIYGSYLFKILATSASGQGSIYFGPSTDMWAANGLRLRAIVSTNSATITDPGGTVTSPSSHAGYATNATYLTLFKITDVAGAGAHTFKMWVVSSNQFDTLRSRGGLTDAKLEGAAIGLQSTNIITRISRNWTGVVPLSSTNYLTTRVSADSGSPVYQFDEIRLGATLADVTPFTPANRGTAISFR
jgi:hypothetical protein